MLQAYQEVVARQLGNLIISHESNTVRGSTPGVMRGFRKNFGIRDTRQFVILEPRSVWTLSTLQHLLYNVCGPYNRKTVC